MFYSKIYSKVVLFRKGYCQRWVGAHSKMMFLFCINVRKGVNGLSFEQ